MTSTDSRISEDEIARLAAADACDGPCQLDHLASGWTTHDLDSQFIRAKQSAPLRAYCGGAGIVPH